MKRIIHRCGFTLIELLVVISIIALLLAILVPALRSVRIQANATICLTRMRDLINAISTYEASLNALPPNYEGRPPEYPTYVDRRYYELIAPYVGRKQKSDSRDNMHTASGFKLFRCPSQDYFTKLLLKTPPGEPVVSPRTGEELHSIGTGQGIYGYNPYFSSEDSLFKHTSQIFLPGELPMLADLSAECPGYLSVQRRDGVAGARFNPRYPHPFAYDYGWRPADAHLGYSNCHSYGPAANHESDRINYAFADGHVEAMDDLWPWYDKTDLVSFRSNYFHPRRGK